LHPNLAPITVISIGLWKWKLGNAGARGVSGVVATYALVGVRGCSPSCQCSPLAGTCFSGWRKRSVQLEDRVHQIAEAVAGEVERELQRRVTLIETLATSPRITQGDFAGFHAQARAALAKDDLVILLHDAANRQQLVNTFLEYGSPLPTTGDPERSTVFSPPNVPRFPISS
jgi:hypothetical protein